MGIAVEGLGWLHHHLTACLACVNEVASTPAGQPAAHTRPGVADRVVPRATGAVRRFLAVEDSDALRGVPEEVRMFAGPVDKVPNFVRCGGVALIAACPRGRKHLVPKLYGHAPAAHPLHQEIRTRVLVRDSCSLGVKSANLDKRSKFVPTVAYS